MKNPDVIIHADWSIKSRNRWYCRADYHDGSYIITGPFQIDRVNEFINYVKGIAAKNDTILLGFDFVIGIPKDYADLASISDFKSWLKLLGEKEWADIFKIATDRSEISIYNPFYPHNPTRPGIKQAHLIEGLNLKHKDQLFRRCEVSNDNRANACPLFWTLGANQVGRGSLNGWQNILQPMISNSTTRLWPFDGTLEELLDQGGIVIAETYPAEYYKPIGLAFDEGRSKRNQDDRRTMASIILKWQNQCHLRFSADLEKDIEDGFGPDNNGDDKFDALIGLLGMLGIITGNIKYNVPLEKETLNIEGWILGA